MRKIKIFYIIIIFTIIMTIFPIKKTNAILSTGGTTGVSLVENGNEITEHDEEDNLILFDNINSKKIKPGKKNSYELAVENSGTTNEFVRITVTKSISCIEGESISSSLLRLGLDDGKNWIIDENTSTENTITMYCKKMLKAGQISANAINEFSIDNEALRLIKEETIEETDGYKTINIGYKLDNAVIAINVIVEAIQAVDVENAIKSMWDIEVELNEDETEIISINN